MTYTKYKNQNTNKITSMDTDLLNLIKSLLFNSLSFIEAPNK